MGDGVRLEIGLGGEVPVAGDGKAGEDEEVDGDDEGGYGTASDAYEEPVYFSGERGRCDPVE